MNGEEVETKAAKNEEASSDSHMEGTEWECWKSLMYCVQN